MSKVWTSEQAPIVAHRDGPAIVLAGAGSGKTTTLAGRALGMILDGIPPQSHLMLTFGNKAAGEMRDRVIAMSGHDERAMRLRVSTYHSWGFRFAREFPGACNRRENVTIADETDQKRLYRRAAADVGYDSKEKREKKTISKVASVYSLAKNHGRTMDSDPDWVRMLLEHQTQWQEFAIIKALELMRAYDRSLQQANAMDFDDLCLYPARALTANRELAELMGRRFRYVTVDESQDTNLTQFEIVKAITRAHGNLMLVGDDKQSIYLFRGARVSNLQDFITECRPKQYFLQRNFRSTAPIVDAAANLIANNVNQLPGRSFSTEKEGRGPYLVVSAGARDMASRIAASIERLIEDGAEPRDVAVMYRTNRLSRMVEMGLRSAGIRYRIVGGLSLYQTVEVKAALGAGRLIQNPRDIEALTALSEFVPGLSAGGIEKIAGQLNGPQGPDVWQAASSVGGKVGEVCRGLFRKIELLRDMGPDQTGHWMKSERGLDMVGFYKTKCQRTNNPDLVEKEGERRLSNLDILDAATAGSLERNSELTAGEDDAKPREYFRILSTDQQWNVFVESRLDDSEPGQGEKDKNVVTCTTVHRAKGLEWAHVIIAGFSDGLMPIRGVEDLDETDESDDSSRVPGSGGGIEEERRLAYVAVTRAKQTCECHHSDDLQPFATKSLCVSPFWKEMGAEMAAPEEHPPKGRYTEDLLAMG